MSYVSVFAYKGGRYFWWALFLIAASTVLYVTQLGGVQPPNGGTWQGYVLGTVGALLIVWLAWLGVRKRRYARGSGTLQGWTSAHVYLGIALLFCASLHSALQLGWNVHTLAYFLMCAVIFSGFFGLYKYTSVPALIARNRSGLSRSKLFAELYDLDQEAQSIAAKCLPEVDESVKSALQRTSLGGGVRAQLFMRDKSTYLEPSENEALPALKANVDQQALVTMVTLRIPQAAKRMEAQNLQSLLRALVRRQAVIRQLRRDISLQGWLKVWLYIHIPLTLALIVSLIVHIVTTFVYW